MVRKRMVLKNKLCKSIFHKIIDHTKFVAKQGNSEEHPDVGYGIKR